MMDTWEERADAAEELTGRILEKIGEMALRKNFVNEDTSVYKTVTSPREELLSVVHSWLEDKAEKNG